MRAPALAALSAISLFSAVQYCPAPFFFVIGPAVGMEAAAAATVDGSLISGAVAGGIGRAGKDKRAATDLPPGVSQQSVDQCNDQLNGAQVTLSGPTPDSVRIDGVPPACMNLATVAAGQPTQEGGPVPVPMGSASLEYQGLTQDELFKLGQFLKVKGYV
ncbi:hypothetical protein PHISCL_01221 [Aspergillus sclerotialis]|uniref:Uncharacterized protein n=1 Tax=Aspergillus sclerotialis TaxID=2070753 RepID=A0A3A2ZUN0_9EURO|nr:hypothetical protein PHISCL_01221 [Aspergillus sclerotialis]